MGGRLPSWQTTLCGRQPAQIGLINGARFGAARSGGGERTESDPVRRGGAFCRQFTVLFRHAALKGRTGKLLILLNRPMRAYYSTHKHIRLSVLGTPEGWHVGLYDIQQRKWTDLDSTVQDTRLKAHR